jgi:hypothetical protein
MRFPPRTLRFRLLLILAGAFALLAAFTPQANAQFCTNCLIRFYDFEGPSPPPPPFFPNLESHAPALETGPGTALVVKDENGNTFPNGTPAPGIDLNLPPGATGPNLASLGNNRSEAHTLNVDIPMFSPGVYDVTSISFAYAREGNGYSFVQLQLSTDGGHSFTSISGPPTFLVLTGLGGDTFSFTIPHGTTLDIPNLVLRLAFTGGDSNGNNIQFRLDNMQVVGDVIPEPATVAAGLLSVFGLCWFQRRRLIRSVRFRKA